MRRLPVLLLVVFTGASLALHLSFVFKLHVIEDESAYLQDAWQISSEVLPFREFGATKGPVFLFLLKGWQLLTGRTLLAGRLFPILFHIASIPLLYLTARNLTRSSVVGLIAAGLWATAPVVVSLTTNVMHVSMELFWMLFALAILSRRRPLSWSTIAIAALLFFISLLTRATAIAFAPLLAWLIITHARSIKHLLVFVVLTTLLVAATVAIIYPLYGWPKTAFFFNADATLIAKDQQTTYAVSGPSAFEKLIIGLQPMWFEGLFIITLASLLPFLRIPTAPAARAAAALLLLALAPILSTPIMAEIASFWEGDTFAPHRAVQRAVYVAVVGAGTLALLGRTAPPPSRVRTPAAVLLVWLVSFIAFYRYWGRTPTPHYVLEIIPALCIAAALTIFTLYEQIRPAVPSPIVPAAAALGTLIAIASLAASFHTIPTHQYRGTMEVEAVQAIARHIQSLVPEGEPIFTAQPIYAYLGERPLYGYYTHPGWYLAERAGFLPASIRGVFFPEFEELARMVERDINWIVVDWRTNDIYFNKNTPQTQLFRRLLAEHFEPTITVPNLASQPITLYQRK